MLPLYKETIVMENQREFQMKFVVFLLLSTSLFAFESKTLHTVINQSCKQECSEFGVDHFEISQESVIAEQFGYEYNLTARAVNTDGSTAFIKQCSGSTFSEEDVYSNIVTCLTEELRRKE